MIFSIFPSESPTQLYSWWWAQRVHFVASELKDPIWHSLEWQIGSFSSEATICASQDRLVYVTTVFTWKIPYTTNTIDTIFYAFVDAFANATAL